MRNYEKYTGILLLAIAITLSACKDDSYVRPTVLITSSVSYDTLIHPKFNASCAISGCHVPSAQTPDLTAANSFNNLWNYGLVDTAAPASSLLYEHLTATGGQSQMPQVGPISPTMEGEILAWIKQGAQNN